MSSDPNAQLPDLRYVRELAKVFKQFGLDEIEIETGDVRLLLRRGGEQALVTTTAVPGAAPMAMPTAASVAAVERQSAAAAVAAEQAGAGEGHDFITSPFVGTFYRAARPDTPAFAEIGDVVQPGQTLCIVEAMKLFNEIEAEFACKLEEILVENGQAVEYGTRLFRVRRL